MAAVLAVLLGAVTPTSDRIAHQILLTTKTRIGAASPRSQYWERWIATSPPYGLHVSSPGWGETEVGPCGVIQYVARTNVLRVTYHRVAPNDARPYNVAISGAIDPAREYRRLFRSGVVRYQGKTTYRGVPAYILVVGRPDNSLTYVVRQANYYPLEMVQRTQTYIERTWFSTFEYWPRTARANRLLHVRSHPGARVVKTGRPRRGTCAGFGTMKR